MSGDWQNESPWLDEVYKIAPHPSHNMLCERKKPLKDKSSNREPWRMAVSERASNLTRNTQSFFLWIKIFCDTEKLSSLVKFSPLGTPDAITQNQTLNLNHATVFFFKKNEKRLTNRQLYGWENISQTATIGRQCISLHGDDWQTLQLTSLAHYLT